MVPNSSTLLGLACVGIGVFGAFNSLTGRLAVCIAALFYPDLTTAPQASGPPSGSLQSGILWLETGPVGKFFTAKGHAKTHNPGTALGR